MKSTAPPARLTLRETVQRLVLTDVIDNSGTIRY